jgi:tripeptidyl-peptidase-1
MQWHTGSISHFIVLPYFVRTGLASNPTPAWQKAEVKAFLKAQSAGKGLPSAVNFNAQGRGYPDVAVVGHNIRLVEGGKQIPADGTSASGPIMAALLTLLNDARLNKGKAPLGFVNPFFYAGRRRV